MLCYTIIIKQVSKILVSYIKEGKINVCFLSISIPTALDCDGKKEGGI